MMTDLPEYLRPGDLLVFNDTRVVAARVVGTKPSGGRVEIFLERATGGREALVQLRASKPIREGLEITTPGGVVRVLGREDELWRVEVPVSGATGSDRESATEAHADAAGSAALAFFEAWGEVPLPPYIHRAADARDRERYQSIFAREKGAVAAPTASLHFDAQLMDRLAAMGVGRAFITLHVGAGTFQPLRTDNLDEHKMHAERVSVSRATWSAIQRARATGGRVVAVGTTVVRALESAAAVMCVGERPSRGASGEVQATNAASGVAATPDARGPKAADVGRTKVADVRRTADVGGTKAADVRRTADIRGTEPANDLATIGPGAEPGKSEISGWSGDTRLFIRPGFEFRVVDAMITNFHLPESTLLMLVSAFAGRENVLAAYGHAVRERYRFFSYGDAMLVTPTRTTPGPRTTPPNGTITP
jgi:S-adenosylmethionine:tRNA ribosyltransferase-isomerase